MTVLYTAHASSTAGREGHVHTDDKRIDTKVHAPGSNGEGTNPEQLFAAGYAACFGQAVKAMAKDHDVDASDVVVNSTVELHKGEDGGFFISADLNVELDGVDQDKAEKIVEAAHQICPYSKATRGNVEVSLQANGADVKAAA